MTVSRRRREGTAGPPVLLALLLAASASGSLHAQTVRASASATVWTAADSPAHDPDSTGEKFSFAAIGDLPYSAEQEERFERLIDDINAHDELLWVVHVGDVKSGGAPCSDEAIRQRFDQLQRLDLPVLYTPGDNEWTDCHRPPAGGFEPTERLAFLRTVFFAEPGWSTGGRRMPVETQARQAGFEEMVENVLWEREGVVFAALHVVGSANGLVPWTGFDPDDAIGAPRPDRIREVLRRTEAAVRWLEQAFDRAETTGAAGIFVFMHANPGFEFTPDDPRRIAYNGLLDVLQRRARAFGGPVVIAHGDSHYFRVDKPLVAQRDDGISRRVVQVTRVEVFGDNDVHWVRVTVDPSTPEVFTVSPMIVEGNRDF